MTHANGLGTAAEWINTVPNEQAGSPPSRNLPGVTYDPGSNRLIMFGGCGGGCWPNLGDVWVLTNANAIEAAPSQWIQLSPTGTAPSPRDASLLNYDPVTNRMILFSGHNGSGTSNAYDDVWVLTNANGTEATTSQWIQISSNIPVAGRFLGSAVYDQQNNRLITFGGKDISGNSTNAVWVLTNANGLGGSPEWVNLLPENTAGSPSPTAGHTSVYDAVNNSLVIFGGSIQVSSTETIQNAVWRLSHANGLGGTPEWTEIMAGSPAPSPRSNSTLGYDSDNQRLVLFGGHHTEFNADPWVLDFNQPMALSRTDIFVTYTPNDGGTPLIPMLFRVDKNGNILWEKHLPFTQLMVDDRLADRNLTEDSFYIVVSYLGWNKVDNKGVLQKFDAYGNLAWSLPILTNESGWGYVSANPVAGGVYLADPDEGIYRIDTNGNIVWGPNTFGCSNSEWSTWEVAADVFTGGAYAANYTCNLVLKLDSNGNEVWREAIPTPVKLNINPVDGGVYIGSGGTSNDTYRLDPDGNIEWHKVDFPSHWTYPRTVSSLDGSIAVIGGWPTAFAKASMAGTILWNTPNDDGNGFNYGSSSLASDLEENYIYTGDMYWLNLGISKYSGADGTTLIWHINPANSVYGHDYGPLYNVWTGVPLPRISPPVLPSSFYGEIHINDNPPVEGNTVQAYVPGVTGAVAAATIATYDSELVYNMDIPGDLLATTAIKEGGAEGDGVTFKIGTRVVATGEWHSGSHVALNFHPPEALPGGSYSAGEGETINFTGSANDWGGDAFVYQWDWNNDGTYDETGVTPGHMWDQYGIYTVGLKVTDAQNGEGSTTVIVNVADVPPTDVSAGGPYTAISGQTVTLNGSATCASVDTCIYDWDLDNNGTFDDATGLSTTKTWYVVGDYIVSLRVTESDGNAVVANADVHITPLTHSIALVPGWNLISFNVQPANTTLAAVLASISGKYDLVYAWDATGASSASGNWLKADNVPLSPDSLGNLNETMGFWIHMNTSGTLNVAGSMPTTTNISVWDDAGGWNLVGYPTAVNGTLPAVLSDLNPDYSLVYAYHANEPGDPWKLFDRTAPVFANDLQSLSPGWGYWIKSSADHTWNVNYVNP